MTIEEAIKVLRTESVEIGGNAVSVCRFLEALDMAVKALEDVAYKDVGKWISVKDRLPDNKEHDWVLAQVVEDNGFMHIPKVMEYRQLRNDWFEETYGWLSEHNGLFSVTHWMPLPEPPKGEERKDGDGNV